jgi:hypothetical protein
MQPLPASYKEMDSDHVRYLYQMDERALSGNLQNRKYNFLSPSNVVYLTNSPLSFFFFT